MVRRAAMNLGDNAIIQDIKIQGQPAGYNYNAPLPKYCIGVSRNRLSWEMAAHDQAQGEWRSSMAI
eukprot:5392360-Pyramimonas_sp.AAC.1